VLLVFIALAVTCGQDLAVVHYRSKTLCMCMCVNFIFVSFVEATKAKRKECKLQIIVISLYSRHLPY